MASGFEACLAVVNFDGHTRGYGAAEKRTTLAAWGQGFESLFSSLEKTRQSRRFAGFYRVRVSDDSLGRSVEIREHVGACSITGLVWRIGRLQWRFCRHAEWHSWASLAVEWSVY